MRTLRTMFLTCAVAFAQAGQTSSTEAAQPAASSPLKPEIKPEDKCELEGTVVDSVTGQPLKKVHLSLRAMDREDGPSFGADTDASGGFLLDDVDPGRYSLNASRNGYVYQSYSPKGSVRRNALLTLSNGEKVKGIVFKLIPEGVISGRILDSDGEPLPRVQVQTLTVAYMRGKKQLVPAGGGSTNDLGEFRVFGLRPGRFILSATYFPQAFMPAPERIAGTGLSDQSYATTYYPNSLDPDRASPIEITPGARITGITITLTRSRTVRVKGLISGGLSPLLRRTLSVSIVPRNSGLLRFPMRNAVQRIDANGNFELRGVAPGSYDLWATGMDDPEVWGGRVSLEVGETNMSGVEITLHPGAEVNGRVVVEENGDLKNAALNFRLQSTFDVVMMMGSPSGFLKKDMAFKLTNVIPGSYDLQVAGLPEGFFVKSIRMGDEDVTQTGLNFEAGIPAGELTVTLNPKGGQIEGAVESAQGEVAAGVMVTLIPEGSGRPLPWLFKTANTDQTGHFVMKGVKPGDYKIYAWEEIEQGAYQDPEYVKRHESAGKSVSIKESAHQNLHVIAISADDTAVPASAR